MGTQMEVEMEILGMKIRSCFLHQAMTPCYSWTDTAFQTLLRSNFFGLILDSKLLWKDHTQMVADKCIRLKNAFSIITKSTKPKHQEPMHPFQEPSPQPHQLRPPGLWLRLQLQSTQNRHSSTLHSQANSGFQAIHAKRSVIR